MRVLRPFSFNEKFAAGLLVLFLPIYIVTRVVFLPDAGVTGGSLAASLFWTVAWAIIGFVAFCAALATLFFKPDQHGANWRRHIGRALPLIAMAIALPLNWAAMDMLAKRDLRSFAQSHEQALSGPAPRAVTYREGIPDGGIAIVRSPGHNPERFSQVVMVELTGERLRSCNAISDMDWACRFD